MKNVIAENSICYNLSYKYLYRTLLNINMLSKCCVFMKISPERNLRFKFYVCETAIIPEGSVLLQNFCKYISPY